MNKFAMPQVTALLIIIAAAICWGLAAPSGLSLAAYHTAILFTATIS